MRKKITIETKQKIQGAIFISPWITGFILFWAYPILYSFVMSLNQIIFRSDRIDWQFIGFKNYAEILGRNPALVDQLMIFTQESLLMIPVIVIFSLIIALLLNQKFKGRMVFRTLFFIPVILTSGNLIMELFNQGGGTTSLEFLQNDVIRSSIVNNLNYRTSAAVLSILSKFVIILWFSGVQILLLIAGLQSISPSVYEAALIDGANSWESLWKITLPGVAPFLGVVSVYTIMEQATLPFNPLINQINYHMTREATGLGYSAAIAWIYFLVVMAMIGIVFLIFRNSMKRQ